MKNSFLQRKELFIVFVCFCAFINMACANAKTEGGRMLVDVTDIQDVSGFLPDEVFIRTMTQSYCKYYSFVLVDGRIYARKTGESEWKLFLKTGLPFSKSLKKKDRFDSPSFIREICADADSLYAFDSDGYLYICYLTDVEGGKEKSLRWHKIFGFPKNSYLLQNELVENKRGWSMGARRAGVLWYEDIYGNEHHFGTMGLETVYFLTEDGQGIRFTDSGLPPDFSRSIQCPLEGRFISQHISVSGDTIFLIGDK